MKSKKINECQVNFINNRMVFYPGEELCGEVYLHLNQPMDTESIEVSCKGKLEVEWKETRHNEENEPYEIEFESKDKLMKEKVKLFGNGERETLPEGEHRFPFSFHIPSDCSMSFEGEDGHIRYRIKLKIKKSWKKDLKLKRMFVVNEIIDVNKSKYRAGPGDNDEKTLGILCCATGPLSLSANLDRAAFCPGEFILITADLNNNTNRELDKLEVELVQHIEYKAKVHGDDVELDGGGTKNYRHTVAQIKTGAIAEESSLSWTSQPLAVPPVVPTFKHKYIQIKYTVHVCVDIPMAFDIDFNFPVTIGTIPCIEKYNDSLPVDVMIPQNRYEPKAPKMGGCDVSLFGLDDVPPWLYSQILNAKSKKMNDKDDDDKEFQDDKYIPFYTFAVPCKVDDHVVSRNGSDTSGPFTPQEASDFIMPPIE